MPNRAPEGCVALGTLQRNAALTRWLTRACPSPLWKYGFKSTYGWEQARFWRALRPQLISGGYDILHVQDPMVAWWCRRARLAGKLRTREILAHGTEEPPHFLAPFDFIQHLAPWHLEQTTAALGHTPPHWCAMPNLVESNRFKPDAAASQRVREQLNIPANAFVVGCAAALKRGHKRIDYLIDEVAACPPELHGRPVHLLLCGATQADTEALLADGAYKLGPRFHPLADLPPEQMPGMLAAMDIFVLASLFEMMPIAVLEALASGTPLLLNDHPVLRGMGGADAPDSERGADCIDMLHRGSLTNALQALVPETQAMRATGARHRAQSMFSTQSVIATYLDYYTTVMQA